jgi:type VI secretion system protein ImpJ
MRNLPVHWSEGMFLRQHHFQAADRFWAETMASSERWDHSYNYGLRKIDLAQEAIGNFQVQLNFCQARMKDGTLVELGSGQEPDRVDFKRALESAKISLETAFARDPVVRVFLGIPKLRLGSSNVGTPGDSVSRYTHSHQSFQDESAGGNDQEIGLKALSVRLLLSNEDLSGFDVLPVAEIQRAGEREPTPRINADYIPPVLAIDAWPGLGRDIVRGVYDMIGKKIEVITDRVLNRGITFDSIEPGCLNMLLMLSQLNTAYATLGVVAFAEGVHPLPAYVELCRIAGQLSVFHKDRRFEPLPRYDHEDLGYIFRTVRDRIQALISTLADDEYEQRFFVGRGMGMQVTLEPKWFNKGWEWYVGVNRGELTEAECRDLVSAKGLDGRGGMDWKLGSSRKVEEYFTRRAQGVELVSIERPPRALPARTWIYYQVSRGNDAWKDVQETQSLAMRFKDALIEDRDRLQGERTLTIRVLRRLVTLQFALFAVPERV